MNIDERDILIFREPYIPEKYSCGTREFRSLNYKTVKRLIELKYLNKTDAQNASPTAEEFYEFLEEHPQFKAHGYCVSPDRIDCRVTIEGIECDKRVSKSAYEDFIDLCRHADELSMTNGSLYAWWD